jgi:pimeloyl-ACP methyl ester carboxylesterase
LKYKEFNSLDDYSRFLKKEIDKLNLDKYILVGQSFGGLIVHNFSYLYKDEKRMKGCIIWAASLNGRNTAQDLVYKYVNDFPLAKFDTDFVFKTVEILNNLGASISTTEIEDLIRYR